jgi:riboflavin kinase, archaea type
LSKKDQSQPKLAKPALIPTMLELLSEGAKDNPVPITTVDLARKLGKSQQIASKHLDELEREGLIERMRSEGRTYVKISPSGVEAASRLYTTLDKIFGQKERTLEVTGTIFSGLGEAAYYVSIDGYRRQFVRKLGFDPFPGTLNVRLNSTVDRKIRRDLAVMSGIRIDGFKDGKRTYGGAECFPAILNKKVRCAVLVIERTSYDDSVLEIIAARSIRKELNLKEGAKVSVKIFLNGFS